MMAIILKLLMESLKAMAGKILFEVVGERFLSRVVAYSIRGLAKKTTNKLDDQLAESIIQSLKRDDLPELK